MGGRGQYSIRKALSAEGITKGTKAGFAHAAETKPARAGNLGGGSDVGRQTDQQMLAEFSGWRNGLSKEQIQAIAGYTNGHYKAMNDLLRGNTSKEAGSKTAESVKNLKSAFNHALSKAVTVYRGTGSSDPAKVANMTKVGNVFRDKGAFSTSISRSFASSWASGKSNAVVFTIRLPQGYKGGAYVRSISPHGHEKELLIKPGQNWRVVKELKGLGYGGHIKHVLIEPV